MQADTNVSDLKESRVRDIIRQEISADRARVQRLIREEIAAAEDAKMLAKLKRQAETPPFLGRLFACFR